MKLKHFILLCLFCVALMLFICYCGSETVMKNGLFENHIEKISLTF